MRRGYLRWDGQVKARAIASFGQSAAVAYQRRNTVQKRFRRDPSSMERNREPPAGFK